MTSNLHHFVALFITKTVIVVLVIG